MTTTNDKQQRDILFWIRAWAEGWMWIGVIVITALGASMVALSFDSAISKWRPFPLYILREFGMALITTGLVTGVVRLFILRYHQRFRNAAQEFLEDEVRQRLDLLGSDVADQTERLISTSSSLNAMNHAGIYRMYANRKAASEDMKNDLEDRDITEIRVIGISLNDFARPEDDNLGEAWKTITGYVRHPEQLAHSLTIRILVIDPHSAGALLRSAGEQREQGTTSSRLQDDVRNTVRLMSELREQAKANDKVSFEFRLYRVPPILFLSSTDRSCYVQQYHFWSTRSDAHIPVFASRVSSTSVTNSLMEGMRDHFEWIWEHASITPEQYHANEVGFDRYLQEAAAVSAYTTADAGKARIRSILKSTRRELLIQGISLKSFFDIGELFQSIGVLVQQGVSVRCLILDPDSEQALFRSFREHLFTGGDVTFEAYSGSGLHVRSPLYQDTAATIDRIRTMLIPGVAGDFGARLYPTAPSCFMLLSDDRVLVEQYHYGKAHELSDVLPMILGKDMPLIEFEAAARELYHGADPRKNPYALLRQHFEFVYEKCSRDIADFVRRDLPQPETRAAGNGHAAPASLGEASTPR